MYIRHEPLFLLIKETSAERIIFLCLGILQGYRKYNEKPGISAVSSVSLNMICLNTGL